jgi:hypothetical protein
MYRVVSPRAYSGKMISPTWLAAELAAQHLVLVAQYEQFDVRGQVRADQHRQQAEQEPQQA